MGLESSPGPCSMELKDVHSIDHEFDHELDHEIDHEFDHELDHEMKMPDYWQE